MFFPIFILFFIHMWLYYHNVVNIYPPLVVKELNQHMCSRIYAKFKLNYWCEIVKKYSTVHLSEVGISKQKGKDSIKWSLSFKLFKFTYVYNKYKLLVRWNGVIQTNKLKRSQKYCYIKRNFVSLQKSPLLIGIIKKWC